MPKPRYQTASGTVLSLGKSELRYFYVHKGEEVELAGKAYSPHFKCFLHQFAGEKSISTIPMSDVVLKATVKGKLETVTRVKGPVPSARGRLRSELGLSGRGSRLPKSPSDGNVTAWQALQQAMNDFDYTELSKADQKKYKALEHALAEGLKVYQLRQDRGVAFADL